MFLDNASVWTTGRPCMLLRVMWPTLRLAFFGTRDSSYCCCTPRRPAPAATLAWESMCMGPSQLQARQREGAQREYPCVDPVVCCPVRGHAWFCVRRVLVLSGALQARMDHGVLGHLVTDCRCVHVRLLELACWLGACSVWGATLAAHILKTW
jgi:hypothetical protein